MADRLDALRGSVDPILTGIVQGYSNEAFVSEKLMPTVPVVKETGKYPKFGGEQMIVNDDVRAIGDDKIKQIPKEDYEMLSYALAEHALAVPIDHREIENAANIVDLQAYYARVVVESLALGKEKERADMLQNPANYATGNKTALSGTDCWTDSASSPIVQLRDAISTIRSKTVQEPNVSLLGRDSFAALQEHADLINKIQYSQLGVVTEDLISAVLSTKNNKIDVVVGTGMYKDPSTGGFVELWDDVAILAYVPKTAPARRSMYQLAFAYTFQKKGYPKAARKAGDYNLTQEVAAFDMWQAKIVANTAGYLFTNTKA